MELSWARRCGQDGRIDFFDDLAVLDPPLQLPCDPCRAFPRLRIMHAPHSVIKARECAHPHKCSLARVDLTEVKDLQDGGVIWPYPTFDKIPETNLPYAPGSQLRRVQLRPLLTNRSLLSGSSSSAWRSALAKDDGFCSS